MTRRPLIWNVVWIDVQQNWGIRETSPDRNDNGVLVAVGMTQSDAVRAAVAVNAKRQA